MSLPTVGMAGNHLLVLCMLRASLPMEGSVRRAQEAQGPKMRCQEELPVESQPGDGCLACRMGEGSWGSRKPIKVLAFVEVQKACQEAQRLLLDVAASAAPEVRAFIERSADGPGNV